MWYIVYLFVLYFCVQFRLDQERFRKRKHFQNATTRRANTARVWRISASALYLLKISRIYTLARCIIKDHRSGSHKRGSPYGTGRCNRYMWRKYIYRLCNPFVSNLYVIDLCCSDLSPGVELPLWSDRCLLIRPSPLPCRSSIGPVGFLIFKKPISYFQNSWPIADMGGHMKISIERPDLLHFIL